MVMTLFSRNNILKLVMISAMSLSGLLTLTKDSFASNSTVVGFIIEAKQMEGTMTSPSIALGDTLDQKSMPMLEMNFENLASDGLIIKKIISTPNGEAIINMSSQDTAHFSNLKLLTTNAEFSESYKPTNGNIGFKNIKILAHFVSANDNSLPKFQLSFDDRIDSQLTPKSESELIQMKALLDSLIGQ
jgi:hypothetical protein